MPISFSMLLTLVASERGTRNAVGLYRSLSPRRDAADASEIDAPAVRYAIPISAISCCRRSFREPAKRRARALLVCARRSRSFPPASAEDIRRWSTRSAGAAVLDKTGKIKTKWKARRRSIGSTRSTGAARPGKRPALWLVRGALWPQEYDRHDRRRVGEIGIVIPQWPLPPWLS